MFFVVKRRPFWEAAILNDVRREMPRRESTELCAVAPSNFDVALAGVVFHFLRALIDLLRRFMRPYLRGLSRFGSTLLHSFAGTLRCALRRVFSVLPRLFHILTCSLCMCSNAQTDSENDSGTDG